MSYSKERIISLLPQGYTLVVYPIDKSVNQATPLYLRCDKGHDWLTARLGNILSLGTRCPTCVNEMRGINRRKNLDEFTLELKNKGYELLSEFKGYAFKINIRCLTCGDTKEALPYNVLQRCQNCYHIQRKKEALEKLQRRLKETGYTLLKEIDETEFVNDIRLHLRCNSEYKKHEYWTRYPKFVIEETLCRSCQNLARLDLSQIRLRLDPGYQVEGVYINETSSLTFTCPKGNTYTNTWNRYQQGERCSCCHGKSTKKLTTDVIKSRLKKLELEWVGSEDEYTNTRNELTLRCLRDTRHFPFKKIFANMYTDSVYCPDCQTKKVSIVENELHIYLKTLNIKVIPTYRGLGFEIDLYLPDLAIGIEYNGLYFHNETSKTKDYHYLKWLKCKENNIKLISIFEDEYFKDKNKCKNYLKHILCNEKITIKLEECEYRQISKEEAYAFYNKYSMSNAPERDAIQTKSFGLWYKNILICSITVTPYENNTLILERQTIHFDYTINCGVDYLIDKAICCYVDITKIIFLFNRRYPHHTAPEGFYFSKEIDPQFTFVRGRNRKSLYQLRIKDKSIEDTIDGRRKEGWVRIYDCGHEIWILNVIEKETDLNVLHFL
jgi:hypothetical protein